MLVTSELVTNAAKATPGRRIAFRARHEDGAVYLAAWDSSAARPIPTMSVAHDAACCPNGGRGLHIIDALAAEWGYRPDPVDPSTGRAGGKWVWARLLA